MVPESASGSERRYGGRTRAERDAERRQRLLDAGLDAFGTAGYSTTSVEALCATAGVSTRNFYDHFASRESLLIAIFDEGVARAQAATLQALLALPADATVRDRARAGLGAFASFMLDDERRARINFVEVLGASRAVEGHRRAALRAFASIVLEVAETLASQGLIQPRPPRLFKVASTALVGAVTESLLDWMSRDGDRIPLDELIEDLGEIMALLAGDPA